MSAIRSALPGEIRAYADANKVEQDRGIVVEAVQRHPRDATILAGRPLDQQGRLAVTGRRGDAHHAALARAGRLDQPGAAHRTRVRVRDRQLGVEQEFIQLDDRPLRRYRVVFRHRGLLACRYGSTSARCGHVNRGTPRVSRPHPTQVSSSCGRAGSRRAISPSARLSARTGSSAPAPITRSCRGDQVGGHSPIIPGRARQTTNATAAASVSRRPFVLTAHHHVLQPDRLDQPRHQPAPAATRRCSLARPTITSTSWQDGGPQSHALDSLVGGAALSQRA